MRQKETRPHRIPPSHPSLRSLSPASIRTPHRPRDAVARHGHGRGRGSASPSPPVRAAPPHASLLLLSGLLRASRTRAPRRPGPAARPQAPAVSGGGEGGESRRRHRFIAVARLRRADAGVRPAAPADKALGLRPAQRADALRRLPECYGRAWSSPHI